MLTALPYNEALHLGASRCCSNITVKPGFASSTLSLNLTNANLSFEVLQHDIQTSPSLASLSLGGPVLCAQNKTLLFACGPNRTAIEIRSTSCTFIRLSGCQKLKSVYITHNDELTSLVFADVISLLDQVVAYNPKLKDLTLTQSALLDISYTSVPYSPLMCSYAGSSAFVAQHLCDQSSYKSHLNPFLRKCLQYVQTLDLANNGELFNNISTLNLVTPPFMSSSYLQGPVYAVYTADTGQHVTLRQASPVLHLEPSPIVCRASPRQAFVLQYANANREKP
eukprot:m.17155 g.17155  ORF g.17155 m.17155 type:complete len:281 (+) comp10656_c1_seq1:1554-2396(+)